MASLSASATLAGPHAMPLDTARLRPFWFPVLPLDQLNEEPASVELLGERLVI